MRQKEVVAWVKERGGDVWYDYARDVGGVPIADARPPGPKWLHDLIGVDYFTSVVRVDILGGDDFSPAARLKGLRSLNLYDTRVTDLAPVTTMTSLEELQLADDTIHDLSPLVDLTRLKFLHLNGNQITDLSPIAKLTSLSEFRLSGTQVTDVSSLRGLTNLKTLQIYATVSDLSPLVNLADLEMLFLKDIVHGTDFSPLSKLTKLRVLTLHKCHVTDLSPLADLTQLESLYLLNNPIADVSALFNLINLKYLNLGQTDVSTLKPLARLTQLQDVLVFGTRVTNEEVIALQQALPNCRIHPN